MKQLRAFALRWQDLHADFAKSVRASQKERFLIRSFQEYLEELGMAHRERISIQNMEQLRGVLRTLRRANKYAFVKDAFDTADSVVELLDGIRVRLIEDHPSMRKLKRSGVACGSEADESGGSQSMGWYLKTGKWADWHFGVGVSFGEPVSFWAYLQGDKVKRLKEAGWTLNQVCRSGTIDEDKLYGLIRKTARSWGVAKR